MADDLGPSKLPRRGAVVDQVDELVRNGSTPAVFAVQVAGFDGLVGSDPDGAERALRELEGRLDRVVRGRDVLGFEPPARFLVGCGGLAPDAAGGVLERIRGGAAFPVDIGGDAVSLVLDVGSAYFAEGATGESLVVDAESDLGRLGD